MEYGPAPENATEAYAFLDKYNRKFQLFINGQWQNPVVKKYFDSINPSNKQKLASIADATSADVDKAVIAAKKALPIWVKIGGHKRAKYLYAIA